MADHKLVIAADGGTVKYEFRSTGEVTPINLEDNDDVSEKRVKGRLHSGYEDSFEFNGAPMNFRIRNDGFPHMTLKLDGTVVWPSQLKMHTAVVTSKEGRAAYGLSSSGKMIRRGKAESHDTRQSETSFEGRSVGGTDKFAFKGTLTGFWCNADCELTIDGVTRTVKGNPPSGSW